MKNIRIPLAALAGFLPGSLHARDKDLPLTNNNQKGAPEVHFGFWRAFLTAGNPPLCPR